MVNQKKKTDKNTAKSTVLRLYGIVVTVLDKPVISFIPFLKEIRK